MSRYSCYRVCRRCESPRYVRPNGIADRFCLPCRVAENQAWRDTHREQARATERAYRTAHPRDRIARNARIRAWRAANPERKAAEDRIYRAAHKEQRAEYNRAWHAAHPGRGTARWYIREARKLATWVEDVERPVVWERDGGVCHICRQSADPNNWHLEHVVPLVRGGEHSYANTAVAHPACNQLKGTKLLEAVAA